MCADCCVSPPPTVMDQGPLETHVFVRGCLGHSLSCSCPSGPVAQSYFSLPASRFVRGGAALRSVSPRTAPFPPTASSALLAARPCALPSYRRCSSDSLAAWRLAQLVHSNRNAADRGARAQPEERQQQQRAVCGVHVLQRAQQH
mmetsp:Transcript_30583/g.76351  ORF Transcript_30583/g.76351 Transcript_30583/m.76351 type:complete len:145 (-) Transcript_30583:93-527(-)